MKYAFKTPTLRNVARRDPYVHDGSSILPRQINDGPTDFEHAAVSAADKTLYGNNNLADQRFRSIVKLTTRRRLQGRDSNAIYGRKASGIKAFHGIETRLGLGFSALLLIK
jgi:hypothetical protein